MHLRAFDRQSLGNCVRQAHQQIAAALVGGDLNIMVLNLQLDDHAPMRRGQTVQQPGRFCDLGQGFRPCHRIGTQLPRIFRMPQKRQSQGE